MASHQTNSARRVVIVGGGVSGLSIAVRLSQSGLAGDATGSLGPGACRVQQEPGLAL